MWYFAWILGLGFAVLLSILSAIWLEFEEGRLKAFNEPKDNKKETSQDNINLDS